MLREIHISNLAVIADARIELDGGLNCFTGATGAGKSLVIGAVEVLLGLRSHTEMLRRGAEEGRVSGVFEIAREDVRQRLSEVTDVALPTGEVLLTRRLHASGRSSVSLNGQPITLAMLKLAAECLVDIHGQHDHQHLLKPSNQLEVLDLFARVGDLRTRYARVWSEWSHAKARLSELQEGRALRQQQLELYRFQASEIDAAGLQPGEWAQMTVRARTLGSVEKLRNETGACHAQLDDSDDPVVRRVKSVAATLVHLAEVDPELRNIAVAVKEAAVGLQEASFDLARYIDRLEVDPEGLVAANDRLTLIGKLAWKYAKSASGSRGPLRTAGPNDEPCASAAPDSDGGSGGRAGPGGPVDDDATSILGYRESLRLQIAELESASEDLGELEARIAPLEREATALAAELTAVRARAAKSLAGQVEAALADLGMARAKLSVVVKPLGMLSASGADAVEFLASTNPGLDPAPLRKIASGGELSRVMLALKGILRSDSRVSVLVFDEIDANVGGRLGAVIGAKLRNLAMHQQVLCITHLPQIAAHADRHLTVRKCQTDDVTSSTIRAVSGADQVRELAEMISGEQVSATTLAQARELLDLASNTRRPECAASAASAIAPSPSPAADPAAPIEAARRDIRLVRTSPSRSPAPARARSRSASARAAKYRS